MIDRNVDVAAVTEMIKIIWDVEKDLMESKRTLELTNPLKDSKAHKLENEIDNFKESIMDTVVDIEMLKNKLEVLLTKIKKYEDD